MAFRWFEAGGSPLEVADGHPATRVSSRATEARTSMAWGSSPAEARTLSMTRDHDLGALLVDAHQPLGQVEPHDGREDPLGLPDGPR